MRAGVKLFTMEHLFHVDPLGSLVEEPQETGRELERAVQPWLAVAIMIYLRYGYSRLRHHYSDAQDRTPGAARQKPYYGQPRRHRI